MEHKTPFGRPYRVHDAIFVSDTLALIIHSEDVPATDEQKKEWAARGIHGAAVRVWHVVGLPGTLYEEHKATHSTKAKALAYAATLIDEIEPTKEIDDTPTEGR